MSLSASAVLLAACRAPQLAHAGGSYAAQFDAVWSRYDSLYPAFGYKGISADDWNRKRARYRPIAAAAHTEDEFIAVVREMLAPLKDLHAWLVDPRGDLVPTYVPTALENFERDRWRRAVRDVGYVAHGTGWGEATIGGFGYLFIGTWNAQQVDINALDLALARFRDAPGLIIDVRPNAGGSDGPAFAFASRFATRPYVVSYVQVRTGKRHEDLGAPEARVIAPRGAWQFTKPVIVLSGRGGFSANESFVAAMGSLPQVTVIGDTTGGASGNPGTFSLGNGWSFTVPRWLEFGPDMKPIEWRGIAPG
ncbi:MAG: S41 family peptidase, partial [Gemmatimonadota bacterium]|nr:S41 family peptidase [Gemmatimonadota bacterium]